MRGGLRISTALILVALSRRRHLVLFLYLKNAVAVSACRVLCNPVVSPRTAFNIVLRLSREPEGGQGNCSLT